MKPTPPPASMGGTSGNGGGGDAQVLDGGMPPLGSPVSDSDSDVTRSGGDDGGLYDEMQPADEAETQLVDGVDEEEEEENVVGDWGETQLVESGEEDDWGDDGDGGGGAEDNAGNWTRTQLVQGCEADGVNNGVGGMAETQVVENSEEEEEEDGVNGGDERSVDHWGKTQLAEDSDEEIGDDELSDSTQVLSDNESLSGDERDAKSGMDKMDVELGMTGNIEGLNGVVGKLGGNENLVESDASTDEEGDKGSGGVGKLGGNENLVESDASTDEEGDKGSGHIQIKLPSVRVATVRTCGISESRDKMSVNGMQQRKQKFSSSAIHPLPKTVDESTSFSTSFGGIDNDSRGYVQNHDKDGTKSRDKCSTAKKLFADTTAGDGESNMRCLAGLSYIGSQEPGDLSQANAFDVVDRLISINGGLSSQETTPNKLEVAKPRVSTKRGTLILAEKVDIGRSSNRKAEIFEWVDSREDDGGGDFFSKNKDILLQKPAGRGKQKSHSTRAKMSTKNARGENKIGESKNKRSIKLPGRSETVPLSDSRLLKSDVKSKRASGNRTKKNLFKDLDYLSNGKSLEEEQEKADVALHDVGPDTQMAVEAMEALVQCSPAKGQPLSDRDTRAEKSRIAKSHSKNDSPQNRISNIQEGVTTRSKRRKVTASNASPQNEKMQENSERVVKIKHKQTKSVPLKSKVSKKFIDENKYHGTPVAHRTRHCGRNDPSEFAELCSNKQSKRGKELTGDGSTVGEVPKKHIKNNPKKPLISERTTESGSSHFEKESAEHTCANDDQDLQQSRNGSTQRTGVNNVQNLVACRVEPTTDVPCRGSLSHPKQRRTATAIVQSKPTTATKHEIPAELARPSKKRRIFVSVSDLLKYAKREPSNGRSASILSSIIASPILNSSVKDDGKTSDLSSSAQRLKESSHVEDTSKSPKSNAQVQNSVMRTPSKVVKELSPTFSPVNPSTGSNRSLSKSSVARELLKQDPESALLNQQRKDSRRRKDMAAVSILFSHHLDDDVIKRQKKILARLGVCEAFSMADATHFVADSFFRTRNMLEAITLGKPVVTSTWLQSCGQAGCFIDERKYILRDAKKEKELGFSMPMSLASAVKHPLLLGKRVFVTSNVKPSQIVVTSLVKASSGQPLERVGRSIMKENEVPDDLLVISCEEDYKTCAPLLEKGAIIFSTELLLNGIVIQKLEYERHRLFTDRVKQTRSSRWLRDTTHDRFVHVPKRPRS